MLNGIKFSRLNQDPSVCAYRTHSLNASQLH